MRRQLDALSERVTFGQSPNEQLNKVALNELQQQLLDVTAQLRKSIGELRPAGFEELGLTPALEGYIAHLRHESGPDIPQIELQSMGIEVSLPEPVAICLFRIAQEALRNSLEHAQARHVQLTLCFSIEKVALHVRDDGCGFRALA